MLHLHELLRDLDKSENLLSRWQLASIAEDVFNIHLNACSLPDDLELKLKSYWVCRTLCTDQHVGVRAYFFEDEFVAISKQESRKCDESFEWRSDKAFSKVMEYLRELDAAYTVRERPTLIQWADYCNLDDEGYKVVFPSQLFSHNEVLHDGKLFKLKWPQTDELEWLNEVELLTPEGVIIVDIQDVKLPWPRKKVEK